MNAEVFPPTDIAARSPITKERSGSNKFFGCILSATGFQFAAGAVIFSWFMRAESARHQIQRLRFKQHIMKNGVCQIFCGKESVLSPSWLPPSQNGICLLELERQEYCLAQISVFPNYRSENRFPQVRFNQRAIAVDEKGWLHIFFLRTLRVAELPLWLMIKLPPLGKLCSVPQRGTLRLTVGTLTHGTVLITLRLSSFVPTVVQCALANLTLCFDHAG